METADLLSSQFARSEVDLLLEQGMTFTLPTGLFLRCFGRKELTFFIGQPYLGTLYKLSKEWLRLVKAKGQNSPLVDDEHFVADNAYTHSRVIAIIYLNSGWKIRLFAGLLAYYFSCRLTSQKILGLNRAIDTLSNVEDFVHSSWSMSASRTTTSAD